VSQQQQCQQINAAYYNRRGHFWLCRAAYEQALSYFEEALRLEDTPAYRDDYGMALVAMQEFLRDPILEEWLRPGHDSQLILNNPKDKYYGFRYEYLQAVGRQGDSFERLRARLEEVRSLSDSTYWSYWMGRCVYESRTQVDRSSFVNVRTELNGSGSEHNDIDKLESDSGRVTNRPPSTEQGPR